MTSSESISDKLKILAKIKNEIEKKANELGASLPPNWDQDLAADLNDLSSKIGGLQDDGSGDKFEEAGRNALLGDLADNDGKWHDANNALNAAKREQSLLAYKLDRWDRVNGESDLSTLQTTYKLNAEVKDADKNADGVLTWNDKNQIDFKSEDVPQDAQTFIDEASTLEITRRSGAKSDAIAGVPKDTRDVGTIRVVEDADHTILVGGGTLNVHRGIEGDATLSVAVGTNGTLNFVSGKGIDPNARDITLSASTTAGKPLGGGEDGGRINFEQGTNAGSAKIVVAEHGALNFKGESDAGSSTIVIGSGGVVGFDGAEAKNATISNDGQLAFLNAKGDDATIENHNDGIAIFKDTSLDRMHLINAGNVSLTGTTTADSASIDMAGGVLSLADVVPTSRNAPAESGGLVIGSLSGTGDVFTAGKSLTLGALGRDDVFGGSIRSGDPQMQGTSVTKIGTGNLTFSGDQSGIDSLTVENGTLTAAHRNALGTGLLALSAPGTISLTNDVYDVKKFENAGTLKLHGYRIVTDEYESKGKDARIESDAKRDPSAPDEVHRGTIHIKKKGDFTDTKIVLTPDGSVTPKELVGKKIQVVTHDPDADVKLGEVDYGSIPTGPGEGGGADGGDGDVVIDPGKEIALLDPSAPHTGNEKGLLDSLQGVTLNDIIEGRAGGAVLGQLVLLPAGSAEQRRAARLLSGESLVNNADAAYGASDAFRSSMETRMLAGGSLPNCNATNGQSAGQNGMSVWGSFKGAGASRSDGEQSFSTSGIDGAFGIDRRLNQNVLVGVSFGLGSRTSRADDLPGDASIRSASVGLYGSYLSDARWFANGGLFFTNHNVTTERTVAARDASARVEGKTSGRTLGLFGEVGQRVLAGGMNVDPFIGMRIASTRLNGYDETDRDAGQGNNGLHVGSQTSNSRRAILGVRLWRELVNTSGGSVIPSLRLAYEHEFGDTQSSLTNAIYGAPRAFTVKGVKLGRDIFTADLGADVRVTRQLNVHVGGDLSLRSGEKAFAGGVTAKYIF